MPNYKPEGLLIDTPANRQAFHSLSALQEAHASGRILESRAVVCDPDHNLIVDMGAWRGIIPVSYTHLDVYKRQVPSCAPPSPRRITADTL